MVRKVGKGKKGKDCTEAKADCGENDMLVRKRPAKKDEVDNGFEAEVKEARKFISKVCLADGTPVKVQIHLRKNGPAPWAVLVRVGAKSISVGANIAIKHGLTLKARLGPA